MSYNNFTTILRQICKSSLITYISKVKYEKSTYGIEYYIYKYNYLINYIILYIYD